MHGIRLTIGLCFAGLGIGAVGVVAVSAGLLEAGAGGALHGGLTAAALAGLIGAAWVFVDRRLAHHLHDHRDLARLAAAGGADVWSASPMHLGETAGGMLKSLTFVVFDTETTGLRPSAGDEIIALAGVRIRAGRIDADDVFDCLVDPGRPIPRASQRIHGISDDMVRGQPPVGEVLVRFRAFVGDAVLVAHNAAFDMAFLKLKEAASGVRFGHLVLDTLALSVFLHRARPEHTLEAIADRFAVPVEGRHTALGDARTTAGVFLAMLDLLEARGVDSLDQVVRLSDAMIAAQALRIRF